jgi:hypothetical protein
VSIEASSSQSTLATISSGQVVSTRLRILGDLQLLGAGDIAATTEDLVAGAVGEQGSGHRRIMPRGGGYSRAT